MAIITKIISKSPRQGSIAMNALKIIISAQYHRIDCNYHLPWKLFLAFLHFLLGVPRCLRFDTNSHSYLWCKSFVCFSIKFFNRKGFSFSHFYFCLTTPYCSQSDAWAPSGAGSSLLPSSQPYLIKLINWFHDASTTTDFSTYWQRSASGAGLKCSRFI